ncbi:MAG: hypothetical protein FJ137_19075 [Deltaproteobacteria bacterium]|nr:hypothetical protein [Deltaproteobacteria bacterium]
MSAPVLRPVCAPLLVALLTAVCASSTLAAPPETTPASAALRPAAPVDTSVTTGANDFVDDLLTGAWLDPADPFWAPRRGERLELALFVGGEGASSGVVPDRLPTLGGLNVDTALRYYPVDRLAVVLGGRMYLGLDGVPAPGTTAATVLSATTGVRYDLVRENRFSLLWDLYSGPSLYLFSDLATAADDALTAKALRYSIGGEMGTALALRYSLGPFTGELRGLFGGRAGSAVSSFRREDDGAVVSGPFSSLYTGVDVGVTWSG